MLTWDDVAQVLGRCSVYDNRNIEPEHVDAWCAAFAIAAPAAVLGDALAAATEHYATETRWAMPADVIAGANRHARDRARMAAEVARQQAIEAAPPAVGLRDRSDEVRQLLGSLRVRLGPSRPELLRRPEWVRADRLRERRQHRAVVDPSGLGWCVPCHAAGRTRLAADPRHGSECPEHLADAAGGPPDEPLRAERGGPRGAGTPEPSEAI